MTHIAWIAIAVFELAQGAGVEDIRLARAREYERLLEEGFRVFCQVNNDLHQADNPAIGPQHFPQDGVRPWTNLFIDAIGLGSVDPNRDSWLRGGGPAPFRLDAALGTGEYKIVESATAEGAAQYIVLERQGLDKLWLDREHGCAVVRREWRWGAGKPLRARIQNADFREGPAGVWLPRDIRTELFCTPETGPDTLCLTVNVSVEKIEMAPNKDYLPSYHGLLVTYAPNYISFIVPRLNPISEPGTLANREPILVRPAMYIMIFGGLIVIIAIVCLVIFHRQIVRHHFVHALIWLGLASAFLPFANGRWTVPFASWLAPVFLVRFLRTQRLLPGLILGGLVFTLASFVHWWKIIPLGRWQYFVFAGVMVQGLFLIFVIDRIISPRLKGLKATFVLPTAWVTIEYLALFVSPYGGWGAMANTQFGFLSLWQMLCVTGTVGIAFLIGWFAAITNYAWEEGFRSRKAGVAMLIYGLTFSAIIAAGQVRLRFFAPEQSTVRIAGITSSGGLDEGEQRGDPAFKKSRLEAQAGAKIIFWPESHVSVPNEDREKFFERASAFARGTEIYLGVTLAVSGSRFTLIAPHGEMLFDRVKQIIVPGMEDKWYLPALRDHEPLPVVDTPYGRITGPICFEMNFPWYVRQSARSGVDIILSPTHDWEELAPWHTYIACARGVELGASVVRHADEGLSMAVDHQGRVLATMDDFKTPDGQDVMVCHVPVRGVSTFYARYGDVFAWVSILGLMSLILFSWRQNCACAGRRSSRSKAGLITD